MNVKDTGDYNLVYLFGDSARWPWHLSSTKNVDMKMINWLGSIPSVIDDDWKQTEKTSPILGGEVERREGGTIIMFFPTPLGIFSLFLWLTP